MEIRFCRGDESAWNDFVERSERASVFHLHGWKDVFEKVYGHKGHYLMALENGVVHAVLPLVQLGGGFFPKGLVSLPFVGPGGICDDGNRAACEGLAHEAFRLARSLGGYLQVRQRAGGAVSELQFPPRHTAMPKMYDMILELTPDVEEMRRRLPRQRRRQIRRATELGLSARWAGLSRLDEFYDVISENMRDLGVPFHGKQFFRALFASFPTRAKLLMVERQGQVVAAAFCLFFKDTILLPWGGSLHRRLDFKSFVYLHWTAIEFGCRNGYRYCDFGRGTEGTGHFLIKSNWGITPVLQPWWGGRLGGKPLAPYYRNLMTPWKRMPLWAANLIGPRLKGSMP